MIPEHPFLPSIYTCICLGISLFGGKSVPLDGFNVVFLNSISKVIHKSHKNLYSGISLFRGKPVPFGGFWIIFWSAKPEIMLNPIKNCALEFPCSAYGNHSLCAVS